MNPRFDMALEARLEWALYESFKRIPALQEVAMIKQCRAYARTADLAKHDFDARRAGRPCSELPLIGEHHQLSRHYYRYMDFKRYDFIAEQRRVRRQRIRDRGRQAKSKAIDKRIANHDWAAFALPSPEALLNLLLTGQSITIGGHYLVFDTSDGITWMDNPYGVEGMLGAEPDTSMCRTFLTTIAHGGQYGPSPN